MKPHSMLIAIDVGDIETYHNDKTWGSYYNQSRIVLKTAKGIEQLGENVFLIDLESGMYAPNLLLKLADDYKLKYKVHFFVEAPDWVLSSPDSGDVAKGA